MDRIIVRRRADVARAFIAFLRVGGSCDYPANTMNTVSYDRCG